MHWLWGALTSRTALKVHVAGVTLTLLGTIYEPTLAQTIPQQVDQLGDTLTEVTNNVNLFGAVVVIVVILVIGSLIDRWRERSAVARDKAEQKEARIEAAKERASLERRLEQKHTQIVGMVDSFSKIAKAMEINRHNDRKTIEAMLEEFRADRIENNRRHNELRTDWRQFKDDMLESMELFGSRSNQALATGLDKLGEKMGDKVAQAIYQSNIDTAKASEASKQEVIRMATTVLLEMNLLQPAAVESTRKDTGQLADINISTENVTVNQNEPKGITDAQAIDIYPPSPTHPSPRAADTGADAEAGTDRSSDTGADGK